MPTLLLNLLLSMIVLPYEKAKAQGGDRIFSGRYSVFERQMGITPTVIQRNTQSLPLYLNLTKTAMLHIMALFTNAMKIMP